MGATVTVFAACFGFWLVLSGRWTALAVGLGLAASALVALANRDLERLSAALRVVPRFLPYAGWLAKEIVVANLQVARVVLHPRLPIDPRVIRWRVGLSGDLALTTLGNSITLTPGTVTLEVEGQELVVHALTADTAAGLVQGSMAGRVAAVFGEPA